MGNVVDKLQYLLETKESIADAIRSKNVFVPKASSFREYAELIQTIEVPDPDEDIKLETGFINPNGRSETIYPNYGYDGFSHVYVTGDNNLTPRNIRGGVSIYGVTGTYETGGELGTLTVTPTGEEITITAESQELDGFSSVTVEGDKNLTPGVIKDGVTVYGVTGKLKTGVSFEFVDSKNLVITTHIIIDKPIPVLPMGLITRV